MQSTQWNIKLLVFGATICLNPARLPLMKAAEIATEEKS
jgi:hypothetical protein